MRARSAFLLIDHRFEGENGLNCLVCVRDLLYILGLGAFLALGDAELDTLAFNQGFEAAPGDCAIVGEDVGAGFRLDEAEASGFIEPFDRTGGGIGHYSFSCLLSVETHGPAK